MLNCPHGRQEGTEDVAFSQQRLNTAYLLKDNR